MMHSITSATPLLRYRSLQLIIITLGLMILPHVQRLPLWVTACVYLLLGYRLIAERYGFRAMNRWLLPLITVLLITALAITYRKLFGREVGVALLLLMLSLKTMELRTLRDVMVVVSLGYFLVFTGFLFSQSMAMACYLLLTVLLMTTALVELNRQVIPVRAERHYWRNNLRRAAAMLLQALPLTLVLFVLFPRISGPLWSLPEDASTASSGLSDTMSPGDISRLILSGEMAFTVRFRGNPPPHRERYWRGPVLSHYDGKSWSRTNVGYDQRIQLLDQTLSDSRSYEYEIRMEAGMDHWLPALDVPTRTPGGIFITRDFQLYSPARLEPRTPYLVSSSPDIRPTLLEKRERINTLQLPSHASPRARKLAQSWRQQGDDREVVSRALAHFRTQPFVYTLMPARLVGDPVDQFLFETREGFCEHYASSFVTLMRAAGIPARVVTGYLGGEMSRFGNYMLVYQSEAHAWAEVWLEPEGWVRVDPTAAIAPERVQSRIDTSVLRQGESVLYQADLPALRELLLAVREGWDYTNRYWQAWIIDYNKLLQHELFNWFGLPDFNWYFPGLLLALFSAVSVTLLALALFRHDRGKADPVQKLYTRYCTRLASSGLARNPAEGAHDFALRVASQDPEAGKKLQRVTELYLMLRYANHHSPELLRTLKREVMV